MKEELREKIIAYNKRRKAEKEAYDDFLMIIKPLSELEKILPRRFGRYWKNTGR